MNKYLDNVRTSRYNNATPIPEQLKVDPHMRRFSVEGANCHEEGHPLSQWATAMEDGLDGTLDIYSERGVEFRVYIQCFKGRHELPEAGYVWKFTDERIEGLLKRKGPYQVEGGADSLMDVLEDAIALLKKFGIGGGKYCYSTTLTDLKMETMMESD